MTANNECIQIEDNIFLGNQKICENQMLLKSLNIQRVLGIGYKHIDPTSRVSNVLYKDIPLKANSEELIGIFGQCFSFISEAQKYDENILINSLSGKTLSAVVLIAFLIKKYKIISEKAIHVFLKKRPISLEQQFAEELEIWQNIILDFNVKNHNRLKRYLFRRFRAKYLTIISEIHSGYMRVAQQLNQLMDSYNRTQQMFYLSIYPRPFQTEDYYCCHKCEIIIFLVSCILANPQVGSEVCPYIYVTAESWNCSQIILHSNHEINYIFGGIHCYRCNALLGEYNWQQNVCHCPLHRGLDQYMVFRYVSDKVFRKTRGV